jgi:oligopeptidase B
MKALSGIAFLFIIIVIGNTVIVAQPSKNGSSGTTMSPPVAKRVPKVLKIHGYEITDNYAWLRDRGEKKDPAIIDYLTAENTYTESFMGQHQPFADALYKEMLGRIKQSDLSVPIKMGEYWYFNKTEEGKQYPTFLRSKTKDGKDAEILLDQNEMAKGHKYYAIGAFEPSDDGNMLAFSTDTTGYRQYTLQFKDLRTGKMLPDKVERVTSTEWSNDGKYLFYSQEDPVSKRDDKVFRHIVGTTDKDTLVFEEKDVLFGLGINRSRDKKMFFLTSDAATMNEIRYLPSDNPLGEWKVISPRRENHEYYATFDNGEFYVLTNKNAENFRVVRAPANDPSEANWKEFIAHNPAVKVDNISFFKDHAIVSEVENGLEYLRVIDRKTKRADQRIATPESVYTMGLGNNPEYDTDVVRYNYASMITPNSTYEIQPGKATNGDQAAGNSQRLRQIAIRDDARLGDRSRRRQSACFDRYEERHKARR